MLNSVAAQLLKHTITGLEPGESYSVAVRVLSGNGTRSAWAVGADVDAGVATAGAEAARLAAPTGLMATADDEMVKLTWNRVTGATSYKVQWKTASQDYGIAMQTDTVAAPTTTGTTVMHTVDDLTNGMEYTFRVMAMAGGADGMPSGEVKQTPKRTTADGPQPTAVYLTPLGRDTIRVDWEYKEEPSVEGASTSTSFQIGWTDATGTVFMDNVLSPQVTKSVGRGDRHTVLEDLKVDQSYLVAVRAIHSDGAGGTIKPVPADWRYREKPASSRRESTPGKVKAPQNLNVAAGDGQLMVTWDAVSAVGMCADAAAGAHCGYLVEWRAAHQGWDNPDRQMHVRDKTSYTIMGLMNGTEYGVRVKAGNERMKATKGYGDPSVEARQTPMMPTPALPVFGVLALGAGLVAAGRRRLRARRQPRLLKS